MVRTIKSVALPPGVVPHIPAPVDVSVKVTVPFAISSGLGA